MNPRNLHLLMIVSLAHAVFACESSDVPPRLELDFGAIDEVTRSARVVDTSYDDVRARKHAIGERVRFEAKILPGTLIRTSENGTTTYFVLAADAQSRYFDTLRRVADELRKLQQTHLSGAVKLATTKPEQFARLVEHYAAQMRNLEAARPTPDDLVGIELAQAEVLARIDDWQHVIGASRGPDWLSPERILGAPATWPSATQLAQRMNEDVITALAFIDDLVNAAPHAIEASITADPSLASRTFDKVYHGAPRAYVREARGRDTFVTRHYARTHLLITSDPTGATVSIGGETVGKTPYLMRALTVGDTIVVALAKRGHATFTKPVTVEASPLGVARFEGVLQPAARRSR